VGRVPPPAELVRTHWRWVNVRFKGCGSFFCCLRRALVDLYVRRAPEHPADYVDEAVYRREVYNRSD